MDLRLVWHRGDLRTHDHPALQAAQAAGPAVGLVILDPANLQTSPRRRSWFFQNVSALRAAYRQRGGELLVRSGVPWEVLPQVVGELQAVAVHAVTSYTPYGRHRDRRAEGAAGVPVHWHGGNYLREPGSLRSQSGQPFRVYTPYARQWWAAAWPKIWDQPERLEAGGVRDTQECPQESSDVPLPPAGEEAALSALDRFLETGLPDYATQRDALDGRGVSRLSSYFNIGVLSVRLAASRALQRGGQGATKWVAELAWRDFMADLLYHRPQLLTETFDPRWEELPWQEDPEAFAAWKAGQTGIPVIDAGMRELRATGFLSNRARMVVAQFLVKGLLLPWNWGEATFKEWLVDGDSASNALGWQWAAGLGVDAAPYFRVFNPVRQGAEHDPEGSWLRRWVPESGGSPEPYQDRFDLQRLRQRYLQAAQQLHGAR
jgi:deoxyribodipyrimidine photo-lyase